MDPSLYRKIENNITTEPWFSNSTQQLAPARESEGMLITTAATAANERRREQKTIMNCFRDRTPSSYTRSNSHIARANGGILQQQHPLNSAGVAPPIQREPRPRPIKLTLLKSSSTRDLSRLLELEDIPTPLPAKSFNSSTDLNKMTSSSSLASSSTSTNCSGSCLRQIQNLEKRINDLETLLNQQQSQSTEMASRVEELTKKIEFLTKESELQNNKRKKSASPRSAKKENTSGIGGATVVVQPSKLVAWMKLSNFWKQRPSIQTLKDQNIYNGE